MRKKQQLALHNLNYKSNIMLKKNKRELYKKL